MRIFRWIAEKWNSLLRKRRLSMLDATDNSEEWHTHISPAGILAAFVTLVLFLFIVILALIAYSPVMELLPGYRSEAVKSREKIINSIVRLDSLERIMNDMLTYNENIALIMEGKAPVMRNLTLQDTLSGSKTPVVPNAMDSALRAQMEGDGQYGLRQSGATPRSIREAIQMSKPVEGVVTERFDPRQNMLGVRITALPEAQIAAVDDGTVVMSLWTPDQGYILQVQHADNLLSIYKHLSQSLVSPGQRVRSGEIIGSNTDQHEDQEEIRLFEFELWNNGNPVDPEKYIVF